MKNESDVPITHFLDYCAATSIGKLMKQRPPTEEGDCAPLSACIQFTKQLCGTSCLFVEPLSN